jgi:uncharacterized protein
MYKRQVLLSLVFILSISVSVFGQTTLTSVVHNVHKIQSEVLGEERTVLVRLPARYAYSTDKFPVTYMLDAHPPQNAMMAGILEQQAWANQMPEMILVGIQNIDRLRDMTPTKTQRGGGEADKFLRFIETEVIPLVEKTYRTQPFRVFAGHSLAGLAAVNCLVTRPNLFNAYIAASPVLHWDNNHVIKQAEVLFEKTPELKKRIYFGIGNEPDYLAGFNAFRELVRKKGPKEFASDSVELKDENHGSVVLPVYLNGLRFIFKGWLPPPVNNLSELENHYKKLSERLNYTVNAPEFLVNQFGYEKLRDGRTSEAVTIFRRNTELYPNSANTYDSLAEALEKNGQLKDASLAYERAYKMALSNGENQLAQTAKANYDRLAAKFN